MRKTGDDEQIASIAPDGPTWSPSWIERVCKMMCDNDGVTITTSSGGWDSGSKVDSVETDANFGCIFHEQQETSYNNHMDMLIINESDINDKIPGSAELNRLMRATNAAAIHFDKMKDRWNKVKYTKGVPKYWMDASMAWADAWSAWLYAATYPQESATWVEGNNELLEYAAAHLKRHSDYCCDYCKTLASDSELDENKQET